MAIYSGFTQEKWWFSIAFCKFTRGYVMEIGDKPSLWTSIGRYIIDISISLTQLEIKQCYKPPKTYFSLVVYLPLWKIWVRQCGLLFPIGGKIKNVPNHQPVFVFSVDKNPPMQLCGAYVVLFFVGVEVTSANHYSFTILEPLQNYIPQFRCKFQDWNDRSSIDMRYIFQSPILAMQFINHISWGCSWGRFFFLGYMLTWVSNNNKV